MVRMATSLIAEPYGEHRCFFCGESACEPFKTSSGFTDWHNVPHPDSKHICLGCAWMTDEKRAMPGKEKPQKTRNYGWFVRPGVDPEPVNKGSKARIREILLSPPSPPWALALPTSGQKHLLHRTPVNIDSDVHCVALETERIWYRVTELRERLALCRRVVASVGHRGAGELSAGVAIGLGRELCGEWLEVRDEPMTRLAMYVTPSQEECKKS